MYVETAVYIGELRILGVMTGDQKYHQVHILKKLGSYNVCS